jgi:cell wall-associated NlpC family hydrolase
MIKFNATQVTRRLSVWLLVAFLFASVGSVAQVVDTFVVNPADVIMPNDTLQPSEPDSVPLALVSDTIALDTISVKTKADSIVEFAQSQLGSTYNYGSKNPKTGFDCSGFCYYVFTNNKVKVPRTSRSYGNVGSEIPLEEARKGDVILFRGTNPNDQTIGHIGIVISGEGEPLQFIHSSSSKKHYGVTITDYYESNYPKRFLKVKRVL